MCEMFDKVKKMLYSRLHQQLPFWLEVKALYCPTVNLEIFARVLLSRNFAYAKFRENKILAKSLRR